MQAILADIHGNLEALNAVLEDLAAQSAAEIYCLGDIVGYGPNPVECVDLAMNFSVALLGDHDEAVRGDHFFRNPSARKSTFWTRRQFAHASRDPEHSSRRLEFLSRLPPMHCEADRLFVHGSPRNPVHEYVFPEDFYNERKLSAIFARVEHGCFLGHTHLPGIFTDDMQFTTPREINGEWRIPGRKWMCNVGSVGQSRDGDWRACYVLCDGNTIRYRRVEYDIELTRRKIRERGDYLG